MELNPPEVFLFVLPYSELFTLTHCSWNKQGGLLFLLKTTVGVVSDDCATVPCEQTFHFTTEWCNERRFSLKQWMKCWKRGGLFCLIGVIIWGHSLFHQWYFSVDTCVMQVMICLSRRTAFCHILLLSIYFSTWAHCEKFFCDVSQVRNTYKGCLNVCETHGL